MKIENREKFLLGLTIAVLALYVGDLVVFEPLAGWWSARSHRIGELRQQIKEGKLMLQREAGIRSRWDSMRTNTLPPNTSLAEQQVLRSLDDWSRDSGAEIAGILPQWKNDSTNYLTLNCRVEAAGGLEPLARFLYNIEKGPLALKLDSVELSTHDNTGQQLTLGLEINGLALAPQTKK